MKKRLLFVVNPISGVKRKEQFIERIQHYFPEDQWLIQIQVSQYPGHAKDLAEKAKFLGYDAVIACGGDGTINEVASAILGSKTALGIIPFGSGNGMARHLGISLQADEAVEAIKAWQIQRIDTGEINNVPFIGVTGIGFDAHIGRRFANLEKRGFWSYFKLVLREYSTFKEKKILLSVNGHHQTHRAMMVTIANGSQFGNNAFIAPHASLTDQKFEVCVVRKFPLYASPAVAYLLFSKKIGRSKYIHSFQAESIRVAHKRKWVHVDGEPKKLGRKLKIKLHPANLSVITGKDRV